MSFSYNKIIKSLMILILFLSFNLLIEHGNCRPLKGDENVLYKRDDDVQWMKELEGSKASNVNLAYSALTLVNARLTNLPDELLIQIISLLPTKDAAAISVLSKSLRHVFPLITSLDFDVSPVSLCLKHPYATECYPTLHTMLSYCLPNLKLLLLSVYVIFDDGFLPRLVSSCPVLEDLTFKAISNRVKITTITSTSLLRMCLNVRIWDDFEDDFNELVLINTPNLNYLDYRDHLAKCYSIPTMHRLIKANLCGFLVPGAEKVLIKDQLPVFHNLIHLELGETEIYCWNKLLLHFLNCSPVLETLVFQEGLVINQYEGTMGDDITKKELELEREFFRTDHEIPVCCRYHLRRIVIKEYFGIEREVVISHFFLRHALVLEELVICLARDRYAIPYQNHISVENTLKNSPKASVTCSIQVL
ncbi:putative F-box/LRR-repeat protein At3g44810 [Chenopodium quinoa]|uniref:putative F-box/LRR-repeat protein At3g44810 n=1 Tax=Chenopodium quinoa TaxID=63459 RepID=UPI000B788D51|nr:putative F-box/LRR-repeat protein At3g44810 [Chenopodium quinoa]